MSANSSPYHRGDHLRDGFNYTNGFHDAANAIATCVSTRALTPRVALAMAAVGNLVGSLPRRPRWPRRSASGIITLPTGHDRPRRGPRRADRRDRLEPDHLVLRHPVVVLARAVRRPGRRDPAGRSAASVLWDGIVEKVIIPMVISPVVGLILGFLVMLAIMWIFRRGHPGKLNRGFRHRPVRLRVRHVGRARHAGRREDHRHRRAGPVRRRLPGQHRRTSRCGCTSDRRACWPSAPTRAAGGSSVPSAARSSTSDPPQGFAAETTASARCSTPPPRYGLPISTTHTITSAIMGVGATKRLSAVRWGVAGNIVIAWVLTFPAAAVAAGYRRPAC